MGSVVVDEHLLAEKRRWWIFFVHGVHQIHVYVHVVGYVLHTISKLQSIHVLIVTYGERVIHLVNFSHIFGGIDGERDEIIFHIVQYQPSPSQHLLVVQHESNITLQDALAVSVYQVDHTFMKVIFCSGVILYNVSLKYLQNSSLPGI